MAGRHCTALKALGLSCNLKVSLPSKHWTEFAKQQGLEQLKLSETSTSGDVKGLSPWRSLTVLELGCTKVSGDVRGLSPLTSLTVLDLCCTKVSGDVRGLSPR